MAGGLIGALRVSLSAETAQFEAGMKRAQRTYGTPEIARNAISTGAVGTSMLVKPSPN